MRIEDEKIRNLEKQIENMETEYREYMNGGFVKSAETIRSRLSGILQALSVFGLEVEHYESDIVKIQKVKA